MVAYIRSGQCWAVQQVLALMFFVWVLDMS